VVKLPKDGVPVGAFAAPAGILDRWIEIPTLKDEPILAAKLAPKDSPPGLIGRIPDGMRAFAIEVNEQTGVSGFILPGHRVDVIQDVRDDRSAAARKKARMILQNVEVLAAGQVISRPEDKSIVVRTVTVAVMPEQVEALVAARSKGPLALALRGLNDVGIVDVEEPKVEEEAPPKVVAKPEPTLPVVVAPAPPPRPRVTPNRHVVIHHGIRRTDVMRVGHMPQAQAASARTLTLVPSAGAGAVSDGDSVGESVGSPEEGLPGAGTPTPGRESGS